MAARFSADLSLVKVAIRVLSSSFRFYMGVQRGAALGQLTLRLVRRASGPGAGTWFARLCSLLLLIGVSAISACDVSQKPAESSLLDAAAAAAVPDSLDLQARLALAIVRGGRYLNHHIDTTGRFDYRVFADSGKIDQEKYNVLRHAGTIYALAQNEHRFDPATRSTIRKAASYLRTTFLHPVSGLDEGISAIFSMPGWERLDSGRREAKLGGTALGIIALLAADEIASGVVTREELKALGRFLLFMQEPDGHFRSKYSETRKFDVDFQSLFYPGEAILALTRLYDADGDPIWLEAAARATAYLVDQRADMTIEDLPKDHWLMIAIGELLPKLAELNPSPIAPVHAYEHAVRLGQSMMQEQTQSTATGVRQGSFKADGRCTPTAARVEGLAALHGLAQRRQDVLLVQDIAASMKPAAAFLLRCQLADGVYAGGVLRAVAKLPDTPDNKTFNRRQSEIRIDYVQHAISAFHGAEHVLADTHSR